MKIIRKVIRKVSFMIKKTIYWIKVLLTYVFLKKKFRIKKGYLHRKNNAFFDDTSNTDNWQKEVYKKAREIFDKNNCNSVIDFGCGSGYKLVNYFGNNETYGIDLEPTYEFLTKKYPNKKWLKFGDYKANKLFADILICSDVIEHVLDPNELIKDIKQIKGVKFYIFSTPDRNLAPTKSFGPPSNRSHIREWNFEEFNLYMKEHFEILSHYISNYEQWTQLIIAKRKN